MIQFVNRKILYKLTQRQLWNYRICIKFRLFTFCAIGYRSAQVHEWQPLYSFARVLYPRWERIEIVSLFVVFGRQINEESSWCSLSMLRNFSESKAFVGEATELGEISFFILLSSVWTSDIFSSKP